MKKGNLTREQAIAIVGEASVLELDAEGCDFTNRVGYNGTVQGDAEVEFAASVSAKDENENDVSLIAYFYQDAEDVDAAEDLDMLSWTIEGYEVA